MLKKKCGCHDQWLVGCLPVLDRDFNVRIFLDALNVLGQTFHDGHFYWAFLTHTTFSDWFFFKVIGTLYGWNCKLCYSTRFYLIYKYCLNIICLFILYSFIPVLVTLNIFKVTGKLEEKKDSPFLIVDVNVLCSLLHCGFKTWRKVMLLIRHIWTLLKWSENI